MNLAEQLYDTQIYKYSYDFFENIIELYFLSFFDVEKNTTVKNKCKLIVSEWSDARFREGENQKYIEWENNFGIPGMLLHSTYESDVLELFIETVDDRYQYWKFISPKLELALV